MPSVHSSKELATAVAGAHDVLRAATTLPSVGRTRLQWIGLFAGPCLAVLAYPALPDTYLGVDGMTAAFTPAGRATASLAVWMAVWWLTEAIDVPATALLPLVVLPLTGAVSMREAAAPYGHDLVFLFIGGVILTLSMQRWGLHRRIALLTLSLAGTRPGGIVAGFMVVTAALSMWLSNTATTLMMLPVALSVIDTVVRDMAEDGRTSEADVRRFAACVMLSIAYAASIGGVATIIGSPATLFVVSYVRDSIGFEITFARWMGFGLLLVAIFLPLAWLVLTRVALPLRLGPIRSGGATARRSYERLGPMNRGERLTLVVFACAVLAWITRPLLMQVEIAGLRPLLGLSDPGIAIAAALALFVLPVDPRRGQFVMDWEHTRGLPWGIVILFGGGLSLAAAIDAHGVAELLGSQVESWRGLPPLALIVLVTTMVTFLSELTSNTATAAALVPILAALAPGLGVHPLVLIVPAAIAVSWAFMLPVGTPPNAIVFGSGHVSMAEMRNAGLWLNLLGIAVVTSFMYWVVLPLLGVLASPAGQ